ncbi:TPA: OmpA family protein, partial [Klebsiella pneumoniae]|nr:OmpA family protein [Klebsiella pneumoniae]
MSRVSNTLKQALLLWSMLLVLALWLGFNQASTAMKFGVTVALIIIAVGLLACWRGKKRQTEADSAWLSRLPPKTYRQPVVLVCGDAAASLFTENPLRQVAGGLYLHVADEEQLIRQAEVLLADRPAWASQLCVACTVVPVVHLDMAVLAGRLRRFVGGLATVRRRAGIKVPLLLWSWLPGTEREDDLPWFICAGGRVQVVTPAGESSPTAWAAQPGTDGSSLRLCHLLRMESLMQWLNQMVLPELNGYPPLAAGM